RIPMASPQLQMEIEEFKTTGEKIAKAPDMKSMRDVMEEMSAPATADVTCTPVNAGGVPSEWIVAPGAADDRFLLYLHGGGYVMGSINTHREMVSRLSRAAGVRALVLGFRLFSGHTLPPAGDAAHA